MWPRHKVRFDIIDDVSDSSVLTVTIDVPDARIFLMAEVHEADRVLYLRRCHLFMIGPPETLRLDRLRYVARIAMEAMDYDEIILEGAARTTGANPGRRPKPFRFTR